MELVAAWPALACLLVAGCNQGSAPTGPAPPHGRYAGVGIYQPLKAWTEQIQASAPSDRAAARLADDQAIIVVQDTVTGEVRACGDLSGYCIGMNPWKAPLAAAQIAPVRLSRATADASAQPAASAAGP
jgi:hypothetical protein